MAVRHRKKILQTHEAHGEGEESIPDKGPCSYMSVQHVLYLTGFRLVNACIIQTYFAPDEFWQCTEIAHRLVYGLGYVTWEWLDHIRGTTHPLIFTSLFWSLKRLNIDTPEILVCSPKTNRYLQ